MFTSGLKGYTRIVQTLLEYDTYMEVRDKQQCLPDHLTCSNYFRARTEMV